MADRQPTRVSISRVGLIERIQQKRAEAEARFEDEVIAYPVKVEEWKTNMVAWLTTIFEQDVGNLRHGWRDSMPYPPTRPDPKHFLDRLAWMYDNRIAMLELSSDEKIVINASDFGEFFR